MTVRARQRKWTNTETRKAIAWRMETPPVSLKEIGRRLDRSPDSVSHRLSRYNCRVEKIWTAMEVRRAVLLRKQHPVHSIPEVARILGRTKASVTLKLYEIGCVEDRRSRAEETRQEVLSMLHGEIEQTDTAIADIVGVHRSYVTALRIKHGIPPMVSRSERSRISVAYRHAYHKARHDAAYIEEASRSEGITDTRRRGKLDKLSRIDQEAIPLECDS